MKRRSSLDISGFKEFLKSVESYTEDLIFGPHPGQSIYHYTDLAGLQGIVQNHDIWLTHSMYSNDDEEITHGYRIVMEVIAEEIKNKPSDEHKNFFDSLSNLIEEPTKEGVYICCFCLDDDLLSQWRGYGASGTGVSLQFNPSKFNYITGPDSPHDGLMRLWKVFYKTDIQKNIIREAINFALNSQAPTIEDKASQAADAIQFFIPTFKNEGFEEEKECRLIFTPPPNCKVEPQYRVSRGMLVPYYSLKELSGNSKEPHKFPITGVRIGPSDNKQLNMESAQMLLTQAGYANVEVNCSNTPFRG